MNNECLCPFNKLAPCRQYCAAYVTVINGCGLLDSIDTIADRLTTINDMLSDSFGSAEFFDALKAMSEMPVVISCLVSAVDNGFGDTNASD